MGQVWKARDSRLNRTVAIKTSNRKFSERFEREAQAIAALNHPHICTLYDERFLVSMANNPAPGAPPLKAGQFVTTGTLTGAPLIGDARKLTCDFGPIGVIELRGERFAETRRFETGSWLAAAAQGRGLGTEMRQAALELGFGVGDLDRRQRTGLDHALIARELLAGCTMPDTLLWVASRLIELRAPGPALPGPCGIVHSRVTGERTTFTRRTVGIHRPSVSQRPSCDQRWVICTRFAATLRCTR